MQSKRWLLSVAFVAGVSFSTLGMTQSELQDLINAAEDGATVVVPEDVTISSNLGISRSVTLTSPEGMTNTITRTVSQVMLTLGGSAPEVRIENLTFDGNAPQCGGAQFCALGQGTLILGPGATVANFDIGGAQGAIGLNANGSARLVMEEGSEIRDCKTSYLGAAVCVRSGAVFDMKGGRITGCVNSYGKESWDYDGTVYIYGGTFNMSGGLITGNTSVNGTAGVVLYGGRFDFSGGSITGNKGGKCGGFYAGGESYLPGTFYLSGDASITNNVGGTANDIFVKNDTATTSDVSGYVKASYTGSATLYTTYEPTNQYRTSDPGYSRCWVRNIFCDPAQSIVGPGRIWSQTYPEFFLDGRFSDDKWIYWGKPTYITDGEGNSEFYGMELIITNRPEEAHTVELCRDLNWNGYWNIPSAVRNLTFKSHGETNYVLRCVDSKYPEVVIVNPKTSVRLENITFQGVYSSVVALYGRLELGPGGTLAGGTRAVTMNTRGAVLVMEDGSVIRDCYNAPGNSYGSAVLIGQDHIPESGAELPRFEMKGGLITNCVCATSSSYPPSSAYGGAVYLYGGDFVMTGGRICGNICTNSCTGVVAYRGTVRFGGDARVEGNIGAGPDLYLCNSCKTSYFGDLRGHIGVSSGTQYEGATFGVKTETGATGAWSFFASGEGAVFNLIGAFNGEEQNLKWGVAKGAVNDIAVATAEDAMRVLPKRITLDEAGRAGLPFVFSGVAAGATGTVELDCSEEELKAAGLLPLTLCSCTDGAFTGRIKFVLPEECSESLIGKRRGDTYLLDVRRWLTLILR